jgi:hypothetical protein
MPRHKDVTVPEVYLDEHGVIHIDLRGWTRLSLDILEKARRQHLRLAPDRKCPVLLHCDSIRSVEYEAERFASAPEVIENIQALGIVVGNPVAQLLGKLFQFYHHPPYPSRICASEKEAVQWLCSAPDQERRVT